MNLLRQVVDYVYAFVNQRIPANFSRQPLRGIFLAPEYMFSRAISGLSYNGGAFRKIQFGTDPLVDDRRGEHRFGERRQMEQPEQEKVRVLFEELSQRCQGLLLIPGTVAWRKPLPVDRALRLQKTCQYAGVLFRTADINMEAVPGRVPVNWPVFNPQYSLTPQKPVHTPLAKTYKLGTAAYVARNTAYCYLDGQCLFKYNKIGDFHEVFHELTTGPDTVHIPDSGPGRFRVPGTQLDFGISVCYDQSLTFTDPGTQNRYGLQYGATPVDVHVLLSASITPNFGAANLKARGYLLSCSSAHDCNDVRATQNIPGFEHIQDILIQDEIGLYNIVL